MKTLKVLSISVLLFALGLTACKPSVEHETKTYKNHLKTLTKLNSEYRAFSPRIGEIKKSAVTEWAKVDAIADLEQKAEAMERINDAIENKLYTQLSSVEYRNKSIDEGVKKILDKKYPKGKISQVQENISEIRKLQRESREVLINADAGTMETAQEAADKAVGLLIDADGLVSRTKSLAGDSKKKKKRKS